MGKTWWYITWSILIKVKPDTDIEELESKINANLPAELKQVTLTRKPALNGLYLLRFPNYIMQKISEMIKKLE